ncbi:hypothetical protein [Psychrobacter immobilis]|uniref:hypothetical protein n=1 Tax=Psychrobacter immobilis TaxID=498 RepID=UPI00191A6E80|nr:hypothetical protein [Psychrobacter immobilis]|tara:strand:+ start:3191 stop:3787 length:597 start_codon:yes stop_codon:yes gene_type:complete
MQELLQLPLQVQATLVAGYLGYILLRRDYRKTEKLVDVWMLILVLGLPTALAVQLWDSAYAYFSIPSGILIAYWWLTRGEKKWRDYLYKKKVSSTLNLGNVWKTLSSHKGVAATQIKLYHKDGTCYASQNTSEFLDEPFAPFTMDEDGIAFYVTHIAKAGENWEEEDDVKLADDLGSMVTYFPREDIKLLEMRYHKQT